MSNPCVLWSWRVPDIIHSTTFIMLSSFTFLYEIKLNIQEKKKKTGPLAHRNVNTWRDVRGASHKQRKSFSDPCFPRQLHFIIIVFNYGPTALPPTTPAVFCSQCQWRVGTRLHCCCHAASAITNNWRKGNECHQDKYECVTHLTKTLPFCPKSSTNTLQLYHVLILHNDCLSMHISFYHLSY